MSIVAQFEGKHLKEKCRVSPYHSCLPMFMCCIFVECSTPFGSQNTEWNDFLDVYKLLERLRKKQQSKFAVSSGCVAFISFKLV